MHGLLSSLSCSPHIKIMLLLSRTICLLYERCTWPVRHCEGMDSESVCSTCGIRGVQPIVTTGDASPAATPGGRSLSFAANAAQYMTVLD